MKKRLFELMFFVLAVTFAATAGEIFCEAKNFPGHVQGITADATGIYWSFYDTIVKTDYKGKTLLTTKIPRHAGDLCAADGKVYVSVTYYDKKMIDAEGGTGWVFVYDRDLKFLKKVAIPDELVTSMTQYTRNPKVVREFRRKLAEAIMAAKQ